MAIDGDIIPVAPGVDKMDISDAQTFDIFHPSTALKRKGRCVQVMTCTHLQSPHEVVNIGGFQSPGGMGTLMFR